MSGRHAEVLARAIEAFDEEFLSKAEMDATVRARAEFVGKVVAAIPEPVRDAIEAALGRCQYPDCGCDEGDTLHHHLAGYCDPGHEPMFSCHPYQPLVAAVSGRGLTAESEALVAELGESPLPGARYARTVVARDLAKVEAAAAREALPSEDDLDAIEDAIGTDFYTNKAACKRALEVIARLRAARESKENPVTEPITPCPDCGHPAAGHTHPDENIACTAVGCSCPRGDLAMVDHGRQAEPVRTACPACGQPHPGGRCVAPGSCGCPGPAGSLPSVEEMARAMIRVTPPERHGQLCPAWVGRDGSPDPVVVCDCWVKGNAPKRAYALVGQLAAARASDGGR